jgi:hypothetical protein
MGLATSSMIADLHLSYELQPVGGSQPQSAGASQHTTGASQEPAMHIRARQKQPEPAEEFKRSPYKQAENYAAECRWS